VPSTTYRLPHKPEYGTAEYEAKREIATLLAVAPPHIAGFREDVIGQILGMRGGFALR